jgi:hypothetical protein
LLLLGLVAADAPPGSCIPEAFSDERIDDFYEALQRWFPTAGAGVHVRDTFGAQMQQNIAQRRQMKFPPTAFPIINVVRMNGELKFGMTVLGS